MREAKSPHRCSRGRFRESRPGCVNRGPESVNAARTRVGFAAECVILRGESVRAGGHRVTRDGRGVIACGDRVRREQGCVGGARRPVAGAGEAVAGRPEAGSRERECGRLERECVRRRGEGVTPGRLHIQVRLAGDAPPRVELIALAARETPLIGELIAPAVRETDRSRRRKPAPEGDTRVPPGRSPERARDSRAFEGRMGGPEPQKQQRPRRTRTALDAKEVRVRDSAARVRDSAVFRERSGGNPARKAVREGSWKLPVRRRKLPVRWRPVSVQYQPAVTRT
jgi:hypothetical protein